MGANRIPLTKQIKTIGKKLTAKGPKLKFYYAWCWKHCKVHPKRMLLESFHGKNISDSTLAVLQAMVQRDIADDYEIYYGSLDPARDEAFAKENGLPIRLVDINSRKYAYILATAKYFLNNSSFPVYFIRRPEQVYVQTWHGTPLKTLGKRMRLGMESMYNVQHNFLQASTITFPNQFTRQAIMRDYNLEQLYCGKVAMVGYPRNAVFLKGENPELRQACGLEGFDTFAYMPTWRGTSNHSVDVSSYAVKVESMLAKVDEALADDQKLFVNFHSMVAGQISLGEYRHIFPFPSTVGNYDFLSQVDALITDYSSVFFDYALTGKPIILFPYDIDEYTEDRGFYFPYESLPFPRVDTDEELCDFLASRAYRGEQPDRSGFDAEYLPYDSGQNAENVLDLLLENAPAGIPVESYADNAKRPWRVFEGTSQRNENDLDTIFSQADPEKDIVLLRRTRFTEAKSAFVHDTHRDWGNYLFVTRTTPRTFIEDVTKRFSSFTQRKLDERENLRLFGNLNIDGAWRREFCSAEVGKSYTLETEAYLPAHISIEGSLLTIDLGDADISPESVFLAQKRVVAWSRGLSESERSNARVELDLAEVTPHLSEQLVPTSTYAVGVLARKNSDGAPCVVIPLMEHAEGGGYLGGYSFDVQDVDGGLPLFGDCSGKRIVALPYLNSLSRAYLYFGIEGEGSPHHRKPVTTWVSTPGNKTASIHMMVEKGNFEVVGVTLKNRLESSDTSFPCDFEVFESGNALRVEAKFDPKGRQFDGIYWDVMMLVREMDGIVYEVPVLAHKGFKRSMLILNRQCVIGDGNVLFPYCAKRGRLAFTFRELHRSDTMATKLKEWAAYILYFALHPYWNRKRMWLVYEKFCSLAQDNGYYFFDYCMQHAPADIRKNIYYVIDYDSPEYQKVAKYGRNVVNFMSFRHMLYCMVAKIYIASDAKSHLYQWRPKPSVVRRRISKHKIFFLQHGVTAMKRVDYLFGKRGSSPMTYFLTTSRSERDIVTESLGYSSAKAPVLGFSRWDVLEDHSDAAAPTILLMPTWRQWLEEVDDALFMESEYYTRYMAFLRDERLQAMLSANNATLKFFIHPKFGTQLKNFQTNLPNVELIEMGSRPLNELIMECSMLITDYSSVAWDVLYTGKPVVYYQFDQARYLEEVGSFIDFDTELPGIVCKEAIEVIQGIESYIEHGFSLRPDDEEIASRWFDFKDTNNRERTMRFLLDAGF